MKSVGIIVEGKQLEINNIQKQQINKQNIKKDLNIGEIPPPTIPLTITTKAIKTTKSPSRKWTSAFRVVQSMTRFRNLPKKHNNYHSGGHFNIGTEFNGSRGSSFSSSAESTPTRCLAVQLDGKDEGIIDPVYLALKQATCKYGNNNSFIDNNNNGGGGSKTSSRRGSQSALLTISNNNSNNQLLFESCTPSPRNLSQTSLQDSGYVGGGGGNNGLLLGSNTIGGSRSLLASGSTPHLHGIGYSFGGLTTTTTNNNNHFNCQQQQQQTSPIIGIKSKQQQTNNNIQNVGGGRRPKLTEKMKSLSLDCADMPPPVQINGGGLGRTQYFKGKHPHPRSARGLAISGESFENSNSFERSESPPNIRNNQSIQQLPRKLPPAPTQSITTTIQQQQQQIKPNETFFSSSSSSTNRLIPPIGTHIVIHEYIRGECSLFLGDRLVVLDNGDPDWKHGFKVNDRLQQLFSFPSTCVAAFRPDEQPMRLKQNCNLIEQKLRLYRDQVVFVQPNSLKDGRVNIRNEHGTCAYCPLQYLMFM
ncbi:hypothetical protein Mgra_00004702 [Meloidogyne graminicola]|uniref:STAC3-related SH3 domain-containing protein n=1 Tax=Meloidogyne graminicola TaxID=189291 RepID=A0A8S9ZRM4_9BILA|nr:hypothetical protein Mgra_00004702 [Meloidogyne graminicola]